MRYPLTPLALIDLISILPSFLEISAVFKVLRFFRLLNVIRTIRIFRVLKIARYSSSVGIVRQVIRRSRAPLLSVTTFAVGYIFVCAVIIFNVEPQTFHTFFDAIYWATVSFTTVGYGDLYPVTMIGRTIAMISSFFGIAIVALPAGIITAGYMSILTEEKEKQHEDIE